MKLAAISAICLGIFTTGNAFTPLPQNPSRSFAGSVNVPSELQSTNLSDDDMNPHQNTPSSNQRSCPFSNTSRAGKDHGVKESRCFIAKGNAYSIPSRKPKIHEIILQMIQIYIIRNPKGFIARLLHGPVSLLEGQAANLPQYLSWKRAAFGENFCVAGQVVLGEWEEVQRALTSPQARKFRLGTAPLSEARLPKAKGKDSFLLSLSQKGASGDGSWEAYSGAVEKYVMSDSYARQDDPIAQGLMDKLTEDYKTMNHEEGGEFFTSTKGGLLPFFNKYLHYCLWGIDPNDEETIDTLLSFYYGAIPPALYWLHTFGFGLSLKDRSVAASIDEVSKIYEKSPDLANFVSSEVNGISRKEMAELTIPLMGIAATQGPYHLLKVAMGASKIRKYEEGVDTSLIKPTEFWDKLNLDDPEEVMNYLFECGRLDQPVGHSHRVALEDFTVRIMLRERKFPKGTVVCIPINMSCVNKNVYGDTVFEFDHTRENLRETSTIFHSVGANHAGRICPGASFAMKMMTEILQRTGKVRRE